MANVNRRGERGEENIEMTQERERETGGRVKALESI